jgi:hypothetical protein
MHNDGDDAFPHAIPSNEQQLQCLYASQQQKLSVLPAPVMHLFSKE